MATPNYAEAAKRRTLARNGGAKPEEAPNLSKIQSMIGVSLNTEQPDEEPDNSTKGYAGPGAAELHQALAQARAGVDSPGPPPSLLKRIHRRQIQGSVTPEAADLGARYGVIPSE